MCPQEAYTLDKKGLKRLLEEVLSRKEPPVARCRLMSGGLAEYHRLDTDAPIENDRGCLGCGSCIDSCPVLRREPERRQEAPQRTSMALESAVGEACEQCYACVLACPQVDPPIKEYIADERVTETIPQIKGLKALDFTLMALLAFLMGLILGIFMKT